VFNQVLGAGDEVVKDVLLASQPAGLVPFFTVLAASAEVGHHVNSTLVEPRPGKGTEKVRLHVHAVPAVALEQRGVAAIKPGSAAADDVQRDARAIFRSRKLTDDLGIVEVNGRSAKQSRADGFARGRVKAVPGRGLEIGRDAENYVTPSSRHHLVDGRDRGQRRSGKGMAL
jgi:hypothetical protein